MGALVRRYNISHRICALLERGTWVVVDRYAYSGVAFSSAKGLDIEWCKASDRGLPLPDRVFFLDIDPLDAAKRSEYGNERYEKLDFQIKVYAQFKKLFDSSFELIDASQSKEKVFQDITASIALLHETKVGDEIKTIF